jgi:hypothetical protein
MFSGSLCGVRRMPVALIALAVVVAGLMLSPPAQAANRVTPGNFTGYGFDQCLAPTQAAMDAWLTSSPYWAVGIYIAGDNRACKDQPNLTPEWVSTQLRNGWRLLPITVGPQASCYDNPKKKIRIKADSTGNYAKARRQGQASANTVAVAAQGLGIAPGSTLWYDLEGFNIDKFHCRESALAFLSAWTVRIHDLGYVSGVYSGASSGIKMLDDAAARRPGAFRMPDYVWIARWNGQPTVEILDQHGNPEYLRPSSWMPHRRVHQYLGDHDETHGGVRINIDSNYMSLGRGTLARRAPRFCGVRADFPRYRLLRPGSTHEQVPAAQCMLRNKKYYAGQITGAYDDATATAVAALQADHGLRPTGRLARTTWTALLSKGGTPVLKVGSGGNQVRRVQRALNAAVHAELEVSGIFDAATTAAVRAYQGERGLRQTGVVADDTWEQLQAGGI